MRKLPEVPEEIRQKLGEFFEWECDNPEYAGVQTMALMLCRILGHLVVLDHCGLPEHDYCAGCGERMPGQGRREADAKAGYCPQCRMPEPRHRMDCSEPRRYEDYPGVGKSEPGPKDGPSEASHRVHTPP